MTTEIKAPRTITPPKNVETIAWKWMRYSGIALVPLVWIHVLLQDVVVGVHGIAEYPGGAHLYVLQRWVDPLWITYDIALLGFTFAHGVNGLRQVLNDFIKNHRTQRIVAWALFVFWLVVSAIGGSAIVLAAKNFIGQL